MPSLSTSVLSNAYLQYFVVFAVAYKTLRWFYAVALYPRYFSPLRHVPGPPVGDPLRGQMQGMYIGEPGVAQLEWVKKYGPAVRVVGPVGIEQLIFTRPEALHQILVEDCMDLPRPDFARKLFRIITGKGLLSVFGDKHRLMRKTMTPAFSIQHLQAQTELYNDPIQGLVEQMALQLQGKSGGDVLLMYDFTSRVALDIICLTGFGYRANSIRNPSDPLKLAYEELLSFQSGTNLLRLILSLNFPLLGRYAVSKSGQRTPWLWKWVPGMWILGRLTECMNLIRTISAAVLKEKVDDALAIGKEDAASKKDIMSLLVRARLAAESDTTVFRMNDEQMMDQILTFLGAGHETTASGLAWALWFLASYPDVQSKLRAELQRTLTPDVLPDYRTLTKELPYLDAVVNECLRVLSPVPATSRKTNRDMIIDGVPVPKDTVLNIPIRVYNMWQELWGPDAESFRPERWLDGSPTVSGPGMTFVIGPHSCIGKTMAVVEMKAVLAALVSNFEFEPAYANQKIKPVATITMKPEDSMPLRVRLVNRT